MRVSRERLLPEEIARHRDTRWLGQDLRCLDAVDSTNTVARELARQGAADGTAVTAESQSAGRGRLGRGWVSPPSLNLYLSVVLRAAIPIERLPQISLLAGVAVCEAIAEWHPAVIKWPNDVLIDGRKVAGILAEMDGQQAPVVVLGVGVNLNAEAADFPDDLRDKATSLRMVLGTPVDRARFTGRLLTHLERRYEELRDGGFAPIAAAWRRHSGLIGRAIRVQEANGPVAGEVVDLDDDGALRLRLASGAEHRVIAGDVTVIDGYAKAPDAPLGRHVPPI